jgi:hypothetical protein
MPSAALERHPIVPCAALRRVSASVTRIPEALQVSYVLEGEIERLRIPPPRPPRVAERLWQHTCCEIFIAPAGLPGYYEFNFSPSGEWAGYAFARYREAKTCAIPAPRIAVQRSTERLELSATVQFNRSKIKVGLSAVVEAEDGTLSYWALRHPPGKPDFHHPAAFALELDEVRD